MTINDSFKEDYLTCGQTRDNFIFENCPIEFLEMARDLLSKRSDEVKSCIVTIDGSYEEGFIKTLQQCSNELQEKTVARDFITSLIVREVVAGENIDEFKKELLDNGINAILSGDFDAVKEYHLESPLPRDVSRLMRKIGRIELNLFLVGTQNVHIQRAINNYISSRESYSVKLFTTNERLPSYLDQMDNRIECPHDYMTMNVRNYIDFEDEKEVE